ncbi:Uncharacterised protein [Bordetella pertussis]|nr:Uncharacterised protein [Bordetella pertussis]
MARAAPCRAVRIDLLLFFAARRVQDEVGDLLRQAEAAGMADADAQAPEIGAAQRGLDVFQAIVAGVAAALLDLDLPRQEVEFVMQHQHLFGRQLVEARHRADGLAGTVHVGDGLEQHDVLARVARLGEHAEEPFLQRKRGAQVVGQVVGEPETGVVAGRFVVGAGVAQPDDQANGI